MQGMELILEEEQTLEVVTEEAQTMEKILEAVMEEVMEKILEVGLLILVVVMEVLKMAGAEVTVETHVQEEIVAAQVLEIPEILEVQQVVEEWTQEMAEEGLRILAISGVAKVEMEEAGMEETLEVE